MIEDKVANDAIKLFKSLNLAKNDIKAVGDLILKVNKFKNLPILTENDKTAFLNAIMSEQERYLNQFIFFTAFSELVKNVKTSEILSELILNFNLLQFQTGCNHTEGDIIYSKKFSNYFPVFKENAISFCKSCFIEFFENRILNNLPALNEDDIVGMGVSGEKDSMAALKAICELKKKSRLKDFNLIIFFIDDGINVPNIKMPYRKPCEDAVKKICKSYDLPLKIYEYKELFGFTIDDLYKMGKNPCFHDSLLMSIVSRKFAHDNKITKFFDVFTENEITRFAFLGLEGLTYNLTPASSPQVSKKKIYGHTFLTYNISMNIRDEENIVYLNCTNTDYNSTIKCPHGRFNLGKLNRELIDQMEKTHPGAISYFREGLTKLFSQEKEPGRIKTTRINICPACNFPSLEGFQRECLICNLKKDLEGAREQKNQ